MAMNPALVVTPSSNWYSAAVTCVGQTFCAVAAYNFVVLYDRNGTTANAVLRAHSHKVTAVTAAHGPDEEVVLSGGRDKVLIAWSVKRQSVLRKQKKLPAEVTALVVCPDDTDTAMVALSNGDIALWNWKRGGRQHHAGALSSAASVLVAVQVQSGPSGVIVAGCENGTIVGLKSATAEQLWMVDISTASDPRKSRTFKNSTSSGGAMGAGGKKGVQDMALTEVQACCDEGAQQGHGPPNCSGRGVLLMAVTTRARQLVVFGWSLQGTEGGTSSRPGVSAEHAAVQKGNVSDFDAMQLSSGVHASSTTTDDLECAPSPCVNKPTFLEQLSVPPPASEVSWLPICWLPQAPVCDASELHSAPNPSAADPSLCTGLRDAAEIPQDQGEERSRQHSLDAQCEPSDVSITTTAEPVNSTRYDASESKSAKIVQSSMQCAWLLLGLPSGRLCLWRVKVHGSAMYTLSLPQSRTGHALHGRPSHSSEAGSWRGSNGANGNDHPSGAGQGSSASWRRSSAIEAKPVKLNADDVHARMLFTVHAMPNSGPGSSGMSTWQVITTSYDRKTVAWELSVSEDGESARMEACRVWTGTGADVLAMCTGQVQPHSKTTRAGPGALFVSTGDKHLRRYHWLQADFPNSGSVHSQDSSSRSRPRQLHQTASGAVDLFFQGIGSEITSLCSIDTLVIAGCSDGTVGMIDTSLPAAKAKFARFSLRHEGSVVSCVAWKSSSSVEAGGSDGHEADTTDALEIFSLGADGTVLQWRGLPVLQDLLSLLCSNTGADKLSALPKPTQLAASIPASILQIGSIRSMNIVQSFLLLGGSNGHLLVVEPPRPGEHSINAALQSPDFNHVGISLVHSAAITAVIGVPRAPIGGAGKTAIGQSSTRALVAAASMLGSIALMSLDPHAISPDSTLVCVKMLTDVSSSVTALQLSTAPPSSPTPSTGGVRDHCVDNTTCQAFSDGALSVAGGSQTAEEDSEEHVAQEDWILCAAARDDVHAWTVCSHVNSESADASGQALSAPGEYDAVYSGTVKGLGHTAAPVCMQLVGQQSFDFGSNATCDSQSVPCASLRLVVACTDRSIRTWPLSQKTLDMNKSAWLAEQQAREAERAERSQARCQKSPSDTAAVVSQAYESIQEARCPETASEAAPLEQQGTAEGLQVSHKQTLEAQPTDFWPITHQLKDRDNPIPAAEIHAVAGDHQGALKDKANLGEQVPSPEPSRVLGTSLTHTPHQDASANSACNPMVSKIVPLHIQGTEPVADSSMQPHSPRGRKAHAGSGTASNVHDTVAAQLSRFVGVRKTTEVSRMRPRACALGAHSMLQRFVDQKLNSGCNELSSLPGTLTSTLVSESFIKDLITFHASEDAAAQSTAASQKPATSTRNASHAAAQRTALLQIWQGNVSEALDTVIEADALNADFVAMSMGAGPEVWRAVVALYATQLAACGEINLAVSYFCSIGDFEQAVMLYKNSGHTLEALTLAERHMPPSSAILRTLRSSLQTQLTQVGGRDALAALSAWSVEVAIANGDVQGAVQMLVEKNAMCSEEVLARACRALEKQSYTEAAAELCSRAALGSSTSPATQKSLWTQAMHQDAGVACVALAIGVVQELLLKVLDCIISIRAEKASEGLSLSDISGPVSRCCSEFASTLLCTLSSYRKMALEPVQTAFFQGILRSALSAINGLGLSAGESVPELMDGVGAPTHAEASESTQKHMRIVTQALLVCVDAALSCVDNQLTLPCHREALTKHILQLKQSIFLLHADKQISESLTIDLAAHLVAESLGVALYNPDTTAIHCAGSSSVHARDAAMDAWASCVADKCLDGCPPPSDRSLQGNTAVSMLQPTVWHSTVLKLLLQRPVEAHAADEDPVLERDQSSYTAGAVADRSDVAAQESPVPEVGVLESALRELNDLPACTSDIDSQHTPSQTPDSAVVLASPEPALSSERKRSGRVNQSRRSGSRADDLHWTEVEAYQRTVQAYTPQVWAAFRQEAISGAVIDRDMEAPGCTGAGDVSTRSVQAGVVLSGVEDLKQAVSRSDAVLNGWSRALHLHPGTEMRLA